MHTSNGTDPPIDPALSIVAVCRMSDIGQSLHADVLVVEEPLEIRVGFEVNGQRSHHTISVTMRTPGQDRDLAVGFLFTEGMLTSPKQIAAVHCCKRGKVVRVDLRAGVTINLARLDRHFYTTSSCGVCGKTSLDAVRVFPAHQTIADWPVLDAEIVHRLPDTLRAAQTVFDRTGGLHAAGLFDIGGNLLCLREDVGRHNALDKLIGAQFLAGRVPLSEDILFVSGRTSFELVQKAAMAGIPIVAAVGAPSSLAVDLARAHGLTLLGFVRNDRFNIYTGAERIRQAMVPTARMALAVI